MSDRRMKSPSRKRAGRERRSRWDVKKIKFEKAPGKNNDNHKDEEIQVSKEAGQLQDGIDDEATNEIPQGETENGDKEVINSSVRKSRWEEDDEEEAAKSNPIKTIPVFNDLPLTNDVLDILLPEGYEILDAPEEFTSGAIDINLDDLNQQNTGYMIPEESHASNKILQDSIVTSVPGMKDLQYFKEEDAKYFGKLLNVDGKSQQQQQKQRGELTIDELKEQKVMRLLLKIKNGSPPVRKQALRQLTDNSRSYGPKILFNQILPLLMEPSLSDRERHVLVKVIDRVLFKLGDLVRPYTDKILKVISPLLADEDPVMRAEAREIISNLVKAAGLVHTISTLRKYIDSQDETLRLTTARTFAVAANTLGIQSLVPFLRAVCGSKKSWVARHTGAKIVQQIAAIVGCGVLPHLNSLVDCLADGVEDDNVQVRKATALALSALAESSAPYGIESFEPVLESLWGGIRRHRGNTLSAYLKCIGNIIPLMDSEYAGYYSNEVFRILLREFNSADDDMKRTVLKVIQQCAAVEGIEVGYLRNEVLPSFMKNFWNRRSALDNRLNRMIIDTTVVLSDRIGYENIVESIISYLKDDSEFLRKMSVDTVDQVFKDLEMVDLKDRTEERLIDGMLIALQKTTGDSSVSSKNSVLKAFGTMVDALDIRMKSYLPQIISIILYRLQNESPEIRQQSADLISKLVKTIKSCNEVDIISKLSKVLYESLGEVYPEVLGSILHSLKTIISIIGITSMNPSIDQLLPSLTPILRNRHEKVQENVIDLIGLIADKASEYIPPKEWMRICFELLELLKSSRKSIRRSANRTFGFIAKAIGPQEVLATLLNNLRVQERQLRVCTAVAIGIVAETCQPFTVIPSIMNEYRTPEKNVQNGVLKAMTFMFEYIGGEMTKDYLYAVTPLLEDALSDRDQIHRQTAATVIKHMAINCAGLGMEEVFIHFLNMLMPNIYETSPHVIERILDGINGIRTNVGAGVFMNYVMIGLWYSARKVRTPYWKLYNDCYVQSCDAMVPYYPKFENDKEAEIEELDVWF
ncbi:U2 snRNP complex subunit [Saccharomycopsis crataegensis]|uniref:U2 snRNP complex subunit n=1 Tax=Saccharomycopsis crataegensis TaxID=43959 RepID=A0AAV5QDH5_9ASCO|nr:U2 snRNP complex subunit [Saccharomycopsis crataegensis]